MRHILIVSFLLFFLKSRAQEKNYFVVFDSTRDSIQFKTDTLVDIFLSDPFYEKKMKAFLKAKKKINSNEPRIVNPPQKYYHFFGILNKSLDLQNLEGIKKADLMKKFALPEKTFYIKVKTPDCHLIFEIKRLLIPYE